jgi:acetolactate synthase-1/2/3 large subunit
LRSFQSDISLAGSAALTLQALAEAVRGESLDAARIHERGLTWEVARAKARAALQAQAETGRTKRPLDKAWVSACVEQVRNDSTIIINELGLDVSQFGFECPGTYFGAPAPGILGWGLGAALGAKLAAPDKTVIACIGDGSYMFGAPTAAHWVARRLQLPVLFIVWNNARWNAVASATRGLYPEGWTAHLNSYPFSDLSPSLDWELVCQAAGGYGERVEDPEEVPAALERALRVVQQEQRQALLNMVSA